MRWDLVITGVGGQGTVLASRVLATAALGQGYDARTAETIGMAQREGSVLSHVRIGDSPVGPLIPLGGARGMIAFEPAEAVRGLPFLARGARAVVNKRPVFPVTVSLGQASYDVEGVLDCLRSALGGVTLVDANEAAAEVGGLRFTNVVMLGAASACGIIPVGRDALVDSLRRVVPHKYVDANVKAFEAGERIIGTGR